MSLKYEWITKPERFLDFSRPLNASSIPRVFLPIKMSHFPALSYTSTSEILQLILLYHIPEPEKKNK